MAKVYCICDNDCKYESMTKEQIIAAIAEATGYVPSGEDDAFIAKVLEGNKGFSLSFWLGTQAQFNELGVDASTYALKVDESGKVYLTPASALEIADSSITAEKLAENAVTSDKVSKGAITKDKLASEVIEAMSARSGGVALNAGSWSNNRQTVNCSGVKADSVVVVSPNPAEGNFKAYAECGVRCESQSNGKLTFACEEVPSTTLSVNVAIFN